MPRLTNVLASLFLLASIAAPAQIIFGVPKRSSAAAGINNSTAPIPTPLVLGRTAFISYELGDVTSFPIAYSGGPERAYGEFYSAMQAWGRYQLVADPADADIVFAVRFVNPIGTVPQIRIGVLDARTGFALWGFVEQVDFKFLKKNRDTAFTESVKLLLADIQTLLGQPPAPGSGPAPGSVPAPAPAPVPAPAKQ